MIERALSLDIDGTVVSRPPLQFGAIISRHVMRRASTMYNPADALPIAAFFPNVEVVIVQDLSAGVLYSSEELAKYPNVRRIAGLKGKIAA